MLQVPVRRTLPTLQSHVGPTPSVLRVPVPVKQTPSALQVPITIKQIPSAVQVPVVIKQIPSAVQVPVPVKQIPSALQVPITIKQIPSALQVPITIKQIPSALSAPVRRTLPVIQSSVKQTLPVLQSLVKQTPRFETIISPQKSPFQRPASLQPISNLQPSQTPSIVTSSQTLGFQTITSPPTQQIQARVNSQTLAPLGSVPGPILSSLSPRSETKHIWNTFRRDDLFLLEHDRQKPYHGRQNEKKTSVHWGQRKLALTTLAMINFFWDPSKIPELTIVYAGAAPGKNLNFVMNHYPHIKWHLYDPHPVGFGIKLVRNPMVTIHDGPVNGFFTDVIANEWKDRNDIFFISDIRTVDINVIKNNAEIEKGIWGDMKMQQKWVTIIKPVVAMLKFRLPWTDIDFSNDIRETAPYLAGIVMKQPWAPQTSTETRLLILRSSMVNGRYLMHDWNIRVYQDKMFHLNSVVRELVRFYNPFHSNDPDRRTEEINPPELTNDWDSLVETTILNDFLTKTGIKIDRLEGTKGLSNLLTLSLKSGRVTKTLNYLRKNPDEAKKYFKAKAI